MSNYKSSVGPELYYSSSIAGTALNTFTTEASLMGGYPICQIPATFFDKTGNESSSAKLRAYGHASSTTTPTFTLAVRFQIGTGVATYSTSAIGWTSTATTTASSVTNAWWQLDMDISLRTLGAGTSSGSSTLTGNGILAGPAFPSPGGSVPATGGANTLTFDTTGITQYFLTLGAACSASSASNAINLETLKIYLEN